MLSLHAINLNGDECSVGAFDPHKTTAVTWGVFPNREIMQPTIFDKETFNIWSKEGCKYCMKTFSIVLIIDQLDTFLRFILAFELWVKAWACIYDDESCSAELIYDIYENYYLVSHVLFSLTLVVYIIIEVMIKRAFPSPHQVAVVDNDYFSPTIFSLFGFDDEFIS